MTRQLRLVHAYLARPVEALVPEELRTGPFVAVSIVSEDLKAKPEHQIRLTEAEAIRLASELLAAVRYKNGDHL